MKLIIYITNEFLKAAGLSALGVIFLILLLDGSDQANFMSTRGIPPIHGFYNSLYRLPDFLLKTLPLIILIGGMVTFIKLSKSLEIIAAKTSGFTFSHILIGPIVMTLSIGLVATGFLNPIASITNSISSQYLISLGITDPTEIQLNNKGIFLRETTDSGYNVIMAEKINNIGTTLYNVKRLEFGAGNIFIKRIQAPTTNLIENAWLMQDATKWETIADNGIKKIIKTNHSKLILKTSITQEQILNSFSDPSMISIWNLPKFISQLQNSGFEARKHLRYLHTELVRPLILVAMLLIACAFTTTITIRRSISVLVVLSLLSGFTLYSFDRLITSLADNNQLPILISSIGPPLSGIFLSLSILIFREEAI